MSMITETMKERCAMRLLALAHANKMGVLDQFLKKNKREKILLSFPENRATHMKICAPGEISVTKCDANALMILNPSVGPLVTIGYLEGWSDVQDDAKCVFLITPTNGIYLYDSSPYGGLYRLSCDITGFIKKGLQKFDGLYRESYMNCVIHVKDGVSRLPQSTQEVKCLFELECLLVWPRGYTFVFGIPDELADDTALLDEGQSKFCSLRQLYVFGHFGPEDCGPAERVPVFIGLDESVYAVHRGTFRLLRLAESIQMFYRLGVRRYFKNHRAVASRLGDEQFFLDLKKL